MKLLKDPAAARIIPFAIYVLILILALPLSKLVESLGQDAHWLYAWKVGFVALLLIVMWRKYSELGWPLGLSLNAWLVALTAGAIVFAVWILPYPAWAVMEGQTVFNPTRPDGEGIDYWLAAIRISGAALVVPLMEELFWRSYIMRWIDRTDFLSADPAVVSVKAFIVTAVLFAVEHNLWLAGLIAGLVYGWLYAKYRNLWVPVLAHAVTNGMLGAWVLSTSRWDYW